MAYVVKLPKLGLEMEQGTVLEWYVEEGDEIEEGAVLLEVESEKSIGEVEARESGVLRLLAIGEDETVPPGTPIGIVADEGEDIADLEAEFDADEKATSDDRPKADADTGGDSEAERSATDDGPAEPAGGEAAPSAESTDMKASPRAKKRAEEVGVALATVDGSGPGGAVTADDVEAAASGATTNADAGTGSDVSTGTGTTAEGVRASPRAKDRATDLGVEFAGVEGTGPQGAITAEDVEQAAATAESSFDDFAGNDLGSDRGTTGDVTDTAATTAATEYHTAALVTDFEDGTTEALIEATTLAREAFAFDVSVLDVLLVAVSAALAEHPALNGTLEGGTHHVHKRQHVALAAGEGQADVVVTNVAERSFADRVATRHGAPESGTREKHEPVTFALATGENLGGSLEPPTVAGLAVDASRRRATPATDGDGVSLARYLSCTLSYDPRAVGDGSAQGFLETVCESIQRAPELLLGTYR